MTGLLDGELAGVHDPRGRADSAAGAPRATGADRRGVRPVVVGVLGAELGRRRLRRRRGPRAVRRCAARGTAAASRGAHREGARRGVCTLGNRGCWTACAGRSRLSSGVATSSAACSHRTNWAAARCSPFIDGRRAALRDRGQRAARDAAPPPRSRRDRPRAPPRRPRRARWAHALPRHRPARRGMPPRALRLRSRRAAPLGAAIPAAAARAARPTWPRGCAMSSWPPWATRWPPIEPEPCC